MKNKINKNSIIISLFVIALVIVCACVMGILKISGVLKTDVSAFLLIFVILSLGIGVYVFCFGLVVKGGYEMAIGGILATIGTVLLLIALKVYWAIILVVGLGMLALILILALIVKAPKLIVEKTDEKEGYTPYLEELKQKKAEEKADLEENPAPTIKSFKD